MKKYLLAIVVGSLLLGEVASAATFNPVCRPSTGGGGVSCADTTVETSSGLTVWTLPVLYATDVQTAHIGTPNGDFTYLQVGSVATLNIANVTQLNTEGLSVSGNATVDGGLDVGEWITANSAQFGSLSIGSGGAISFWDNPWGGISALSTGTWLRANTFLLSRWNGTGACWVTKSLDGTKSRWHWTDNNGDDQSTTSLGSVPAQCLYTDGTP